MRLLRATRRPAGFTLLEIILAVSIFGLTMIAITTVMRTGVRSWTIGHALSELMQTARVSQDLVVRDLNNICYRAETDYNQTFRNQISRIGSEIIASSPHDPMNPYGNFDASMLSKFDPSQRGKRRDDDNSIFFDEISPPIDLSFRGSEDRFSFVRRQNPEWGEAESAWGLRRITYYVKDGTLWRDESDPFGFRPGAGLTQFISTLNPEFNPLDMLDTKSYSRQSTAAPTSALGQLTQFFATPDENATDNTGRGQFLPASFHYSEPVCDGIVKFSIAYGYFLEGEWVEVANWDSNAMQYRTPFDREYFQDLYDKGVLSAQAIGNMIGTIPRQVDRFSSSYRAPETNFGAAPTAVMNPTMNQPDNLPGYVAIQISAKSPQLKGSRTYTFTIFHSMPMAEETDIRFDEESILAANADQHYRDQGYRRYERRDKNHTSRFNRSRR